MSLPYAKKVVADSGVRCQSFGSARTTDEPDFAAALILAMTAVFMAMGFSMALGLRPEAGVLCTALASLAYTGVQRKRRTRQVPVEPSDASVDGQREQRAGSMPIALHTPATIYSPRHIPSWCALSCAGGAVNGFAFLSCEEFVSHITGTSTRVGLEWHHLGLAVEYALVLVSFVVGAVASVIWLQARACRGKRPRWATPLRAVALILACAAIVGHQGYFGPFHGEMSDEPPFILLSVLAFAMGLQNAAVASTTGLAVRTTHLTGPATDVGIHLGTALFASGSERREAFKGAGLRVGKIVAFVLGAGLALPLASHFEYLALLAPASLISMAAALSFLPDWGPSDFPLPQCDA